MELQDLIRQIDALKAEIDSLRPLDPEREARVMQKFRLDWNYHSSNIEGNSLTYGETKTFLLHGLTASGKPLKDHLEIKGHNEAILGLEEIVKGERPLTEHEIRSFHQVILGERYQTQAQTENGVMTQRWITPGQYKIQPNHVRTATGEMFYFATPEETPAEMESLISWYRESIADPEMHPLLVAAIFHYKFIRIHPFDDGNGRIARILMNLVLMMNGYPPAIIRTEDKENYYRALRQADGGDEGMFIAYIGEQLVRSMEVFIRGALGGEIEEKDDIYKKISLFKARIMEPGSESIQVKCSPDAVHKTMDVSFIPFVRNLAGALAKFDDLFFERELNLTFQGDYPRALIKKNDPGATRAFQVESFNLREIQETHSLLEDAIASLEDNSKQNTLNRASFQYSWKGYKAGATNPFNYAVNVWVVFTEFTYLIGADEQQSLSRLYHQSVSDRDGWDMIGKITESVIEDLEKRINRP